jgi:precorrin-6Y C5,15-methyltransferase (decarboxylating)
VVAAVTEDSRVDLHRFSADKPTRWTELGVARGETLAGQRIMRPQLPVLLARLDRSLP